MTNRILVFGSLAERIGREIECDVPPEGCSVAALRRQLVSSNPAYEALGTPRNRACVDEEIVLEDHIVRPGQELAFFPPVSGG